MRAALQQLGAALGRGALGEPQRPLELVGCLAVGAESCRTLGRRRRIPEHRRRVSGSLRMVGQPGWIRRARGGSGKRSHDDGVQRQPAIRRHRPLDGETGQLVPESDAACRWREHPGRDALLDALGVAAHQLAK